MKGLNSRLRRALTLSAERAARISGRPCDPLALDFPTVEDGARGIAMIGACVESARTGSWVKVRLEP